MTPAELICQELGEMDLSPRIVSNGGFIQNIAIEIRYRIPNGRLKNQTIRLAIGFQEDGYPEYPPHFIYMVSLPNPKLPVHSSFEYDGVQWVAFSVPPSDFWDSIPLEEKNMRTYMNRHLLRFWEQI